MWKGLSDARFLLWLMVAGGLFVRVWHYAANHTIWFDEAVLLLNVMRLDYAGLLGPTEYAVAAPPLFMWALRTVYLTVGDQPYLWRLLPFAFSVGVLLLTVPLARRLFPPHLAALAVGLVAVSDSHVWLGCCIKPYASDTFIITGLLLYLVSTREWSAVKRLLPLAAVTPLLFGFSYTAMIGMGAVLAAMIPAGWNGGTRGRLAWVVTAAVAAGTLALLHFGPMKAQRIPALVNEWWRDFPDYAHPWTIPWWVVSHTLGVCMHACHPSGYVLGLLAPLGVWGLWRDGRKELAAACVGMFVLAVAAAAVKAYPYGAHRLSQFLAPAMLVLGMAGVGQIARRWKWAAVVLGVLLFVAADAFTLFHLVDPWHRPDSAAVSRHVRTHRQPDDALLSDDICYVYYLPGEVRRLSEAAGVPVGGRVWVMIDFFNDDIADKRTRAAAALTALGFEPRETVPFTRAEAWLWERTAPAATP